MKFGKFIVSERVPEWQRKYVDYKALKQIIKGAELVRDNYRGTEVHRKAFFFALDRELEKVSRFYNAQASRLRSRLQSLILTSKRIADDSDCTLAELQSLHVALDGLQSELMQVQEFVKLNTEGFRKILKKHDKKLMQTTQEVYISRQVDIQPFSDHKTLTKMLEVVMDHLHRVHCIKQQRFRNSDVVLMTGGDTCDSFNHSQESQRVHVDALAAAVSTCNIDELARLLSPYIKPAYSSSTNDVVQHAQSTLFPLLLQACRQGNEDCVSCLLNAGTQPWGKHATDDRAEATCLHLAAGATNVGALRTLLAVNDHCEMEHDKQHVSMKRIDAPDIYGRSPLHYSALNNCPDAMSELLARNANSLHLDFDGCTALYYAIVHGFHDCVRILVDHLGGATMLREDMLGSSSNHTPLALAALMGKTEVVRLLIDMGADVNATDTDGLTALHLACRDGRLEIVKLLVHEAGADITIRARNAQWTPLFEAASEGHESCIEVLLSRPGSHGTDNVDSHGWTPADHAGYRGYFELSGLLRADEDPPVCMSSSDAHTNHVQRSNDILSPRSQALVRLEPNPSTIATSLERPTSSKVEFNVELSPRTSNALPDGKMPDFSLPPPVLPFRHYGHTYINTQTALILRFGKRSVPTTCAQSQSVSLLNNKPMMPVKVVMIMGTGDGIDDRHEVLMPLDDEEETFSFLAESLNDMVLRLDVVPSFSDEIIGRAIVSGEQLAHGAGNLTVSILDSNLSVAGSISFDYLLVKPCRTDPGAMSHMYWKTTKIIEAESVSPERQTAKRRRISEDTEHDDTGSSWVSPVRSATTYSNTTRRDSELSAFRGRQRNLSSCGDTEVPLATDTPGVSGKPEMVIESSLAPVYKQLHVRLTKDSEPVVISTPRVTLNIDCVDGTTLEKTTYVSVSALDMTCLQTLWRPLCTEKNALLRLSDHFTQIPTSVSINIRVEPPTSDGCESCVWHHHDINAYVDAVLDTLHRHSISQSTPRKILLSSSCPDLCLVLSLKQPNYPVFFITEAGLGTTSAHHRDARCRSLRHAVKFARRANLLGIVCPARPLLSLPILVPSVKKSGLLLFAAVAGECNLLNNYADAASKYFQLDIDAVLFEDCEILYIAHHEWRGGVSTPLFTRSPISEHIETKKTYTKQDSSSSTTNANTCKSLKKRSSLFFDIS